MKDEIVKVTVERGIDVMWRIENGRLIFEESTQDRIPSRPELVGGTITAKRVTE